MKLEDLRLASWRVHEEVAKIPEMMLIVRWRISKINRIGKLILQLKR